jgi:hypothetical protein
LRRLQSGLWPGNRRCTGQQPGAADIRRAIENQSKINIPGMTSPHLMAAAEADLAEFKRAQAPVELCGGACCGEVAAPAVAAIPAVSGEAIRRQIETRGAIRLAASGIGAAGGGVAPGGRPGAGFLPGL